MDTYKTSFKLLLFAFSLAWISACNSQAPRITSGTTSHCKNIERKKITTLSEQLAKVSDEMLNKTGVYVLEQGTEAMLTRAWLTSHAEQTIDIQYFIFSADNIGLLATDYLVRAADRGVKIRLLVDDIMVDAKGSELLLLDAHENLSVRIYNPMANVGKNILQKINNLTTDFHALNQRMHNKTFIVDNKVAITGGRNIADEYFGYDHEYNFRDRDVMLISGEVNHVQRSFEQFWQHPLSQPVTALLNDNKYKNIEPNYDALHEYACDPQNFLPSIRQQIENMPDVFEQIRLTGPLYWLDDVQYISDIPGKNDQQQFLSGGGLSTDKLIELIAQAQSTVTIQTPYLVTTKLGKSVLKQAIERGVEVQILTNSLASNDNLEAFSGYQRDRHELLKLGVKIFEFKPDAQIRQKVMSKELHSKLPRTPIFGLHAKTMVVDDHITVIGTFNLDPRSANLNTESITVINSTDIAAEVKSGMQAEMMPENAWSVTLDWNPDKEVSLSKRLRVKSRIIVPKSIL